MSRINIESYSKFNSNPTLLSASGVVASVGQRASAPSVSFCFIHFLQETTQMNKPIKVIPTPLIYEDYWLTCRELFNSHKQPDWDKLHKLRKTYIKELKVRSLVTAAKQTSWPCILRASKSCRSHSQLKTFRSVIASLKKRKATASKQDHSRPYLWHEHIGQRYVAFGVI